MIVPERDRLHMEKHQLACAEQDRKQQATFPAILLMKMERSSLRRCSTASMQLPSRILIRKPGLSGF
jgi:hypothetical protein